MGPAPVLQQPQLGAALLRGRGTTREHGLRGFRDKRQIGHAAGMRAGLRRAPVVVMAVVMAMAAVACGSNSGQSGTPGASSPSASAVPAASATAGAQGTGTEPATATNVSATTTPGAASTPSPSGETGITGIATIGPTCPVERVDSPCPDRPYQARISVWRGDTVVAETSSGADGRFSVSVPPGTYRVVGESGATFPRGVETTVTVVGGQLLRVTLRFDSGIR